MTRSLLMKLAGAALCLAVQVATAATVGDIGAFYFSTAPNACVTALCSANNSVGVVDDVVFVIQNTSATAITNAMLSFAGSGSFPADSFNIGTIAANSQVIVEPGVSNDALVHPASGLFFHSGSPIDESDLGYPGDATFSFSGQQGAVSIIAQDICGTIGSFTPVCTAGVSNDGTIRNINFLGGPVDNDGPCSNCFGPQVVANLVAATVTTTPEPAAISLLGLGLAALVTLQTRRRSARR